MTRVRLIELASMLDGATDTAFVDLRLTLDKGQTITMSLSLDKAREVAGMLTSAIEAATSDAALWHYLRQTLGMTPEAAGRALDAVREQRQGSAAAVHAN